jgi:hypothetical protein
MTIDAEFPTTSSGLTAPSANTVVRAPVDELRPYPGNARVHDLAAIGESLSVNGQYRPIVAQWSTKYVLVGNGTLAAAIDLGWDEINVMFVDVDDDRARRIVLADNRTSDLGAYDESALLALLNDFDGDLLGTAYSEDALEDLIAAQGAVPETEPEAFTGDYAESRGDTERRRNTGTPRAESGLKEVVLIFDTEQLPEFYERTEYYKKVWGTDSMSETVLRALQECGGDE